jgi:hypothetical protein
MTREEAIVAGRDFAVRLVVHFTNNVVVFAYFC